MVKREKLIGKLRRNPNNVRFKDIDKLLLSFGFEKRQRGSHATYVLQGQGRITIPFRMPFILPVYVKEVLKLLDELDIASDE
ncbi:MAG: type II toxin-antitoxin system HicA family toxin [Anaerolineales bacterium]|nr:type II toxin-antitoxin system HicA family toxin [Anaerolineales bacterium]